MKVLRDWHVFCQTRESICFSIWMPNHVQIWFDPDSDFVTVRNLAVMPMLVKDRWAKSVTNLSGDVSYVIAPGIWLFEYSVADSFIVAVLPRSHALEAHDILGQGDKRNATGKLKLAVSHPSTSIHNHRSIQAANLGGGQSSSRFSLCTTVNGHKEIEYEVSNVQRVGSTGSANVFRAQLSSYTKVVVVKAFKARGNLVSSGISWQHEVNICKRLPSECEYIVKFLGSDARLRWLLFEEARGSNLASPQWRDRYSNKFTGTIYQTHSIIFQLASALAFLYEQSMLHNDLKPANVVFDGQNARLIDFGLATDAKLSNSVCHGGTPWYIPPEYSNHRRSSPSDVWALGIVTLYLLGRISLPELSREVQVWRIKDVGNANSEATKLMLTWMKLVREMTNTLADGGKLENLANQMLEPLRRNRITASDLVCRIKALELQEALREPMSNESLANEAEISTQIATLPCARKRVKRRTK